MFMPKTMSVKALDILPTTQRHPAQVDRGWDARRESHGSETRIPTALERRRGEDGSPSTSKAWLVSHRRGAHRTAAPPIAVRDHS